MNSYRRIIPCLDVDAGRVVKGVRFVDIRDAGDPVEIARRYDEAGADELVFLDITASSEGRGAMLDMVTQVAAVISIPLTVGGGIRSLADIDQLLAAGANRISIGSAAVAEPELVAQAAQRFGSERLMVAIDAKQIGAPENEPRWEVFIHGGRTGTGLDVIDWAQRMANAGAGQLLLTSMDRDGTKAGFDNALTRAVVDTVAIPVIASGGVGNLQHLADGILLGKADAVLAASIFHFGDYSVTEAKQFLASQGIEVRL